MLCRICVERTYIGSTPTLPSASFGSFYNLQVTQSEEILTDGRMGAIPAVFSGGGGGGRPVSKVIPTLQTKKLFRAKLIGRNRKARKYLQKLSKYCNMA